MVTHDKEELERLRQQLKTVTAERDRLLAENRRLRQEPGKPCKSVPINPSESVSATRSSSGAIVKATTAILVNNDSSLPEKVNLFRSLFRGREDVFARAYWSRAIGRIGYSPACRHEWNHALCEKPRVKCGDCPNRDFSPLTDDVIRGHLEGKHTVGIYPMLLDETCRFLAIDFDNKSWQDDIAAFLETCRQEGIPAAMERSRSGNGGHIWIFFSEAVPAPEARKLGCYLLTETMARRHEVGMDSYDKLFPNQDTLPKGGFGNLIALPLQKRPTEQGNTLFLDDNFRPYPNQWAFLASITRLRTSALDDIVRTAVRSGQVLGVRPSLTGEEEQPWTMMPSRRPPESPLPGPLPARVRVVTSNLVYVEKEGLPSPLLNRIKRLAAFQNPEFYKRQSLRLSIGRTPRLICCAEEFPKHIGIPRGCLDELRELLERAGIAVQVVDEYFRGTEIMVAFRGRLTPSQEIAVSELQRHDNGVLVAPSGSGKTVVGINMIAARGVNTLVLVHRRPLLEQWRAQLSNFLDVDQAKIGQIGGGKGKPTGFIDVAMMQSLSRKGEVNDLIAGYGQVIVDECHHLPAVTFEQVLRQAKARYVIGLTATPYRRDGQQAIILMQCGPARHIISQKTQQSQGLLRHRLIYHDTAFVLPAQDSEPSIHGIYAALIADEKRNQQIIDDVLQAINEGRFPILLTERREHLELFAERLAKFVPNVIVLCGGMGARQRRVATERLAAISGNDKRVLLATGRYIGEGFDDARLDTLFLAMPVSWKGTLVQYAGRLHRLYAGKTEVRIHDYVDRNCPVLMRMFQKRLRGYRSMGYDSMNPTFDWPG